MHLGIKENLATSYAALNELSAKLLPEQLQTHQPCIPRHITSTIHMSAVQIQTSYSINQTIYLFKSDHVY